MKKTIDIDIEVYKAIELARIDFNETQNEILRRILKLDQRLNFTASKQIPSFMIEDFPEEQLSKNHKSLSDEIRSFQKEKLNSKIFNSFKYEPIGEWIYGGVKLKNGTKLQKWYLGTRYEAVIENGSIVFDGQSYQSPSTAAMAITQGANVNGWLFWEYLDESNGRWEKLGNLRKGGV